MSFARRLSSRLSRSLALVAGASLVTMVAFVIEACSSDDPVGAGASDDAAVAPADGSVSKDDSSAPPDAGGDSAVKPDGAKVTGEAGPPGETCVGFGKGTPCGTASYPDYGYVCFDGGPPGFLGCQRASTTSFGDTYCCPENKCVSQPDQDKECKSAAAPHRYQCPPNGSGGSVQPPPGCADAGGGASPVERFYCCP